MRGTECTCERVNCWSPPSTGAVEAGVDWGCGAWTTGNTTGHKPTAKNSSMMLGWLMRSFHEEGGLRGTT